jgi:hypothetical protein
VFYFNNGKLCKTFPGTGRGFAVRNDRIVGFVDAYTAPNFLVATASGQAQSDSSFLIPIGTKQVGVDINPVTINASGLASTNSYTLIRHFKANNISGFKVKNGLLERVWQGAEGFATKDGTLWPKIDVPPNTVEPITANGRAISDSQNPVFQVTFDGTAHQLTGSAYSSTDCSSLSANVYFGGLFPALFRNGVLFQHLAAKTTIGALQPDGTLYRVASNCRGGRTEISSTLDNHAVVMKGGPLVADMGGLGDLYLRVLQISAVGVSISGANTEDYGLINIFTPPGALFFKKGILFRHTSGTSRYYDSTVGFTNGKLYDTVLLRKEYPVTVVEIGASGGAVTNGTADLTQVTPPKLELTASGQAVTDGTVEEYILSELTASGHATTDATVVDPIIIKFHPVTASGQAVSGKVSALVNSYYSVKSTGLASSKPLNNSVHICQWFNVKSTTGKATSAKVSANIWVGYLAECSAFGRATTSGTAHANLWRSVSSTTGKATTSTRNVTAIITTPITASGHAVSGSYWRVRLTASGHSVTDGSSNGETIYCHIVSASGHAQTSKYDEILGQILGVCNASGHSRITPQAHNNWYHAVRSTTGLARIFPSKVNIYLTHTLVATANGLSTTGGFAHSPPPNTHIARASARARSYPYCSVDVKFHLYVLSWRKLYWNPTDSTKYYDVYRCDQPGGTYYKIGTAAQQPKPNYRVEIDLRPRNLAVQRVSEGIRLDWNEPEINGYPMTFKAVPIKYDETPMFTPNPDTSWVTDALPAAATWLNQDGLTTSAFRRHGDTSLKVSTSNGYVEPRFTGATQTIPGGNYIIVWVYLEKESLPDTFWCSFYDNNNWEHRFYWGNNLCPFGKVGEPSRMYAEELPIPGMWTPLIVDTSDINISEIHGMSFGLMKENGSATIYIDSVYYTEQPIVKMPWPHIGLYPYDTYTINRGGELYSRTSLTEFLDTNITSTNGFTVTGGQPLYTFERSRVEDKVVITWGIPDGAGTNYLYEVASMDMTGALTNFVNVSTTVSEDYDHTEITISSPSTPQFTVTASGNSYEHSGVISGETYHYIFTTYDSQDNVTSTVEKDYTMPYGSVLGHFKLGKSVLV